MGALKGRDDMANWTKEKPTDGGWYWYRLNRDYPPEIVHIYINDNVIDGWWAKAEPPEWDRE